jgi:DNA gyrase subunit A
LSKDKIINNASKWFDSGEHKTLKLTTLKGYELTGTHNHPLLILTKDEKGKPIFVWKLMEKIKEGDFVVIDRSTDALWPEGLIDLSKFYPKIKKRTKIRGLPRCLDKKLAFILGSFVAGGTLSKNKIEFCNTNENLIKDIEKFWKETFPDTNLHKFKKKPSSYGKKEYYILECHSRYVNEFLRNIGLRDLKSNKRQVPETILQSPKEIVIYFLKAYFEGDGLVFSKGKTVEVCCCSKSEVLIKELQILLLRFGVDSFKRLDKRNDQSKILWNLSIRGYRNLLRFYKEIGFYSNLKNKKLEFIVYSYKKDTSIYDFVPFISDYIRKLNNSGFIIKNNFDRYGNMRENYKQVSKLVLEKEKINLNYIFEYFLNYNYLFDRVVNLAEAGIRKVYSIKVESKCHSFISNGFISHNTEAKLSKIAEEILEDVDKETVGFIPNYDNSLKEPIVLPSKIPNLLINGSSGIAVGMATNIPPHNINEVINAVNLVIENNNIELNELIKIIRGPDFPTGGIIFGKQGIIDAYKTGRGKILVRGKARIEQRRIIIEEIPYQVNKTLLIENIAELVKEKRIEGISDIRDESDRKGMRLLIELKKDINPEIILNQLYQHTQLQTTFGIIMLALDENKPKIMNLKDLINSFIKHRFIVVTKRTKFDLEKAEKRVHILEGLKIALKNIDDIVKLIKESNNVEKAKLSLIENYSLTQEQSLAILDMKLQRLTSLEQDKIQNEHNELIKLVIELKDILANENKIYEIIKNELNELKNKFGDERKTLIEEKGEIVLDEDLIQKEDVVVTLTYSGYIKQTSLTEYRQQKRGGKGLIGTETKEEDLVKDLFITNNLNTLLIFTNKGKCFQLKTYELPLEGRYSKGKAIINLLKLENDEKVTNILPINKFDGYLIFVTKKGIIKKTKIIEYENPRSSGLNAIKLINDELIDVILSSGNDEIIIGSKFGLASRFNEKDVINVGRNSVGVRGIKLNENDEVIGMEKINENSTLLTITSNGYGKRTKVNEYRLIKRGGKGVTNILTKYLKENSRNEDVVAIKSAFDDEEIMIITEKGMTIRIPINQISIVGRNTSGVRVIKLENDKVSSVAKISKE